MQNYEARYQQLKARITGVYEPSANRVVNAVEQSPLVVVTGAFSNGKSESLIPLISAKLVPKGYRAAIRDAQRAKYQRPNYAEGLMSSMDDHTNVLIIDEAGEIGVVFFYCFRLQFFFRQKILWNEAKNRLDSSSFLDIFKGLQKVQSWEVLFLHTSYSCL